MSPSAGAPYLIVAASGRQLAQSAARGGHDVVVVDWFADRDTCAAAQAVRRAVSRQELRFDPDTLLQAVEELAPAASCAGLVAGSGLEDAPPLLQHLTLGRRLYGNEAQVVAATKDPARFFPLLDRLGIPHPEVSLRRPPDTCGWLAKRVGGAGGAHVVPAAACGADEDGIYFQRREDGRSLSLLFLANGRRAWIVGCSEQLHADSSLGQPFLFAGVIGGVSLPPAAEDALQAALDALVEEYALVGLNGIDFLLLDDRCSVLELNPRPTAALDCYDADFACGLFDWHLRACGGELPGFAHAPGAARGHAVVYAGARGTVQSDTRFPAWCSDLPQPGTRYAAADPLCTVHASASTPDAVRRLLAQRVAAMQHLLTAEAA